MPVPDLGPDAGPADVVPSPALSQVYAEPGPIAGRVIGVVATPGADLAGIAALRRALAARGAVLRVVGPSVGSSAPAPGPRRWSGRC